MFPGARGLRVTCCAVRNVEEETGKAIMRLMRRLLPCLLVGIAPTIASASVIEPSGLEEVARSIDGLRAQLARMSMAGGELDQLLERAHRDVEDLITKFGKEEKKLEKEVMLDLDEQQTKFFLKATALMKKTNLTLKASAFPITDELTKSMRQVPKEVADQIRPLVLAIWGPLLSKDSIQIEGTEITFRSRGYYRLIFDVRQAKNLDVRVDHKAVFSPRNPMDTRVDVEIPASILVSRFRDQEREFVPIELVSRNETNAVRFIGSLDLKPLFGVEYDLKEFGPQGQRKWGVIEQGAALDEILRAVATAMKAEGADCLKIAVRHAQVYRMAKTRLPYGSSFVDLHPGFDEFELTITPENGATRTLDRNRPRFGGVSVHSREEVGSDSMAFWRLTIDADLPTEK